MIELTESAWTVDAAETLAVISEIRATGVRLAIDDFGAGYSSLSRLRELDFDVIKVDRGLLADDPGGQRRASRSCGRSSTSPRPAGPPSSPRASRTEEQLDYLTAHRISQAQGFLLGRPAPARAS